jgi:hypothetical protein
LAERKAQSKPPTTNAVGAGGIFPRLWTMAHCAVAVRMLLVGNNHAPLIVILNLFQDNARRQFVMLKQVQHDAKLS